MCNYAKIIGVTQEEFDDYFKKGGDVEKAAQNKARHYSGSIRKIRIDRQDFLQEMFVAFLESLPDYNPREGSVYTWAQQVMRFSASKFIREQTAKCRDPRRVTTSLDAEHHSEDGQSIPKGDTVTKADRNRHHKKQTKQTRVAA